eukprot:2477022-Pleurochrysis_carterae.AAC.1
MRLVGQSCMRACALSSSLMVRPILPSRSITPERTPSCSSCMKTQHTCTRLQREACAVRVENSMHRRAEQSRKCML